MFDSRLCLSCWLTLTVLPNCNWMREGLQGGEGDKEEMEGIGKG